MKKALVLCLTAVMLTLACGAYANGEGGGQIQFRGIPWGSTYSEAVALLPAGIEMKTPVPVDDWYPIRELMTFEHGRGKMAWSELGFLVLTEDGATDGMQVAGYDVSGLTLYFAHRPDGTGKLVRDDAHTAFYFGYYTLHPVNTDVVYEDLKAKLTALYGGGTQENQDRCFWYGANGTMLSLSRYHANFGSDTIYIAYGYAEGENWMLTAYEAETYTELEQPDSSIEGL